jgi:Fe-S cluster assembly iron-binding protein IscA
VDRPVGKSFVAAEAKSFLVAGPSVSTSVSSKAPRVTIVQRLSRSRWLTPGNWVGLASKRATWEEYIMLQLTHEAAEWIRKLRDEQGRQDDLLRIAREGGSTTDGIALSFVTAAPDSDQVGLSEGVPLSVAAELAEALENKVIDVTAAPDGRRLVLRAA